MGKCFIRLAASVPVFLMDDVYIVLLACLALALLAHWRRVLTPAGSLAAFVVGMVIGIAGGLSWILLLLIFLVTSFAATRYRFKLKKRRGVQEGKRGERTWRNVAANGLVPTLMALLVLDNAPWPTLDRYTGSVLFLCAVAIAASDTLASELGVLSKRTWLITSRKRVRAGVNGGVSYPGEFWALTAALYVGISGVLLMGYFEPDIGFEWWDVALVTVIGFIGCQVDSVIGATIETKGHVSKLTNNLISITLGTVLAWLLLTLL
jgi:uncharacterized protein (TIGR00297 family)